MACSEPGLTAGGQRWESQQSFICRSPSLPIARITAWAIPPPPVCGKIVFHKTGPWCQKGWGTLILEDRWSLNNVDMNCASPFILRFFFNTYTAGPPYPWMQNLRMPRANSKGPEHPQISVPISCTQSPTDTKGRLYLHYTHFKKTLKPNLNRSLLKILFIYRHTLSYCTSFYCASQIWHFLQIKVLWQPCLDQFYWHQFSKSVCSLHVLCVTFGSFSQYYITLSLLLYLLWWSVISDLWYYYCNCFGDTNCTHKKWWT